MVRAGSIENTLNEECVFSTLPFLFQTVRVGYVNRVLTPPQLHGVASCPETCQS